MDNLWTKNGNSSFFKPKIRGLYTSGVTDQERVIVARVWYILFMQNHEKKIEMCIFKLCTAILQDFRHLKIGFRTNN